MNPPATKGSRKALLLHALVLVALGGRAEGGGDTPVDLGTTERVEVRLVTVQAIVLDRADRTVSDLTADDFELIVDGKPTKVDTLDLFCPLGTAEDPQAGSMRARRQVPAVGGTGRRIVLAFDYYHLNQMMEAREEALAYSKSMIEYRASPDDEIMVVALAGGVRIEQPFTRDHDQVVRTLVRMRRDITLWAGYFGHENEYPLFASLEGLLNVLAVYPEPKALVLFSVGQGPGEQYDRDFWEIAGLATSAATAIYPVDCQGLVPGPGFG